MICKKPSLRSNYSRRPAKQSKGPNTKNGGVDKMDSSTPTSNHENTSEASGSNNKLFLIDGIQFFFDR